MLTFFRRIRKGLLGEGAIPKYLLYAIGEILLVMIGILLALQVNNWNEERKLKALEKQLLIGIKENIQSNLSLIVEVIENNEFGSQSVGIVLNHLDKRLPYQDSLDAGFASIAEIQQFFFSKPAFETLQSQGLTIIKSKYLRNLIIDLFEVEYSILQDFMNDFVNDYYATSVVPIMTDNLRLGFGFARPDNYEALLENSSFKNMVFYTQGCRFFTIEKAGNLIRESNYVIEQIDNELEK